MYGIGRDSGLGTTLQPGWSVHLDLPCNISEIPYFGGQLQIEGEVSRTDEKVYLRLWGWANMLGIQLGAAEGGQGLLIPCPRHFRQTEARDIDFMHMLSIQSA